MDLLTDTYSEEYRHQCEVKWLSRLSLQDRRLFLADVQEKRGLTAANNLKGSLTELWEKKSSK